MRGIFLSIVIGLISLGISSLHPSLDSLVLSIIIGILIGNLFEERFLLQSGLKSCIRFCLPVGIILYGTQLTLTTDNISHFLIVPVIFIFTFTLTYLLSRFFGISKPFSFLLSAGLSVCGSIAITIISPLVGAKREETSLSIISIMVVGLFGLIFYSLFNAISGLNNEGFALFTGTTLPMLGQVKVVGGMIGGEILHKAMNYKLLRVSLLMLLIIWFGLISKDSKEEGYVFFPGIMRILLVAGFLTMVVVANTIMPGIQGLFEPLSRFFLTVTLAAIGLSVDFDSIADIGPRPLYAVFIAWILTDLMVYLYSHYYV